MNECETKECLGTGPGQEIGIESLEAFFGRTPRFAIAFSGGCDSSYLVAAALAAGCDVCAYLVRSAFQPPCEIEDAKRLAVERGLNLAIIDADVLVEDAVCSNPPDRCYWCKTFIFSTILDRMRADGYEVLADGTNASDDPTHRPGFRALAELGVVSPLRRAGMSKDDVRLASHDLALFTADKPSFSCLAVHVPQGRYITAEELYAAAALPDVVARVVARNAAVGAALDTECNAAFTADENAVFKQSSSKVEER